MDSLFLIGLLILFALIASPIMAIIALNRSREARDATQRLKQQVEALQKQLAAKEREWSEIPVAPRQPESAAPVPVNQTAVVSDEPVTAPAEMAHNVDLIAEPVIAQQQPAVPADTTISAPAPTPKANVRPPEAEPVANPLAGVVSWFFKGNPVAKLGILLLFFGIGYLLKYSIERDMFPIELRLAGAALSSIVLLGLGWRLRNKQPLYGLILQGGCRRCFIHHGICRL
ncbi:DUF2339 domain-containing protein [Budvicia aquatica]|uniref:Predicted membrane protein n=1 Tax=Budvicia aquatica TaxID=82979 RepID=A0A484ZFY4_9GAMM|nr:Predicted membrane protein [Budvicia aquatica]